MDRCDDAAATACSTDADCSGLGGTETCLGAPLAHDLTSDTDYTGHLALLDQNGDGHPDLAVHFEVPGSGLTSATTEVCIRGRFTLAVTGDADFEFETRDSINTN